MNGRTPAPSLLVVLSYREICKSRERRERRRYTGPHATRICNSRFNLLRGPLEVRGIEAVSETMTDREVISTPNKSSLGQRKILTKIWNFRLYYQRTNLKGLHLLLVATISPFHGTSIPSSTNDRINPVNCEIMYLLY